VLCRSCGSKIDYTKYPEVRLGVIECPNCYNWIDRTGRVVKEVLKPGKKFIPLKATGTAYHELEYYKPEDAWNYFCKYFVNQEGSVRAEMKIDGLRCIVQLIDGKPLIYFEDAKIDRSHVFHNVIDELKQLGVKNVILDGELMEWKDRKWVQRQNLLKWAHSKNPGSDENVRLFIFDILYIDEKDLHSLPLKERVKYLKMLSRKFKKHFIKCPAFNITSLQALTKIFKYFRTKTSKDVHFLKERNGIDGFMIKTINSDYPLNGKTDKWLKLKYVQEIDVIVLQKKVTANKNFQYLCGYKIPQNRINKYVPLFKLQGKWYGVIGKTFNTKINVSKGDIINCAVLDIKKRVLNGKVSYTWFQSRVITAKPGKQEPDPVSFIDRISILVEKSELSKKLPVTGQWTFEEGMTGKYAIQVHVRGLSKNQIDNLSKDELKKFGIDPQYFIPDNKQIKLLNSIFKAPWKKLIKLASEKDTKSLSKVIKQIYRTVDFDKLTKTQKHALALVEPVSIHQDIRMIPAEKSYFEGGHWTTPGNQFKENKLLKIDDHIHLLFMLKTPHVEEYSGKVKEPVIRGPASWYSVGEPLLIVPPNSVGSTPNAYALFNRIDTGKWVAGVQVSPHGKHFHEFYYYKGKILSGRIIYMYAPVGEKKERIWLCYKPKNQKLRSEEATRIVEKL
ncbi:MAG: ATP-dependent DNA ligase, partial [Candidatus Odinarchaeia archaeon]